MNKKTKIIILSFSVILITSVIIFLSINNKSNKNTKDESIKLSTYSFTIGDNNTDLGIMIENPTNKEVKIKEIVIILYDSQDKVIETITEKIDIKIKENKNEIINLTFKEKYVNVSNIKYETKS